MEDSKKKLIEFKKWLKSKNYDSSILKAKIHEVLYETQISCFDRQTELLDIGHVVANVSAARSGKTLVAALTAIYRDQAIFPIYPKNLSNVWKTEIDIIGAKYWSPEKSRTNSKEQCGISYSMLRGKTVCNNSIVTRDGDNYTITPEFRKALYEGPGIVVVFDEIQDAKNPERLLQKVLTAISEEVAKSKKSKLIIQSASPFCKPEYVEMFPRLAGVMDGVVMQYDETTKELVPYGLNQLISYCKNLDEIETKKILPSRITISNEKFLLYNLTTKVLIPNISVAIQKRNKAYRHIQENRFYSLTGAPFERLSVIDQKYRRSKGMCAGTGNTEQLFKCQNEYDSESELIKCEYIIVDEVKKIARLDPRAKFPIFVNFHKSADLLYEKLNSCFPGQVSILNGTVKTEEERVAILNKFNEDSDELMIIIGSAEICGIGKDFGDLYGNRRRVTFICPNTNFIESYQASFRADHPDAKSDSWAINVYVDISSDLNKFKVNNNKANTVRDAIGKKYEINHIDTIINNKLSPFNFGIPQTSTVDSPVAVNKSIVNLNTKKHSINTKLLPRTSLSRIETH